MKVLIDKSAKRALKKITSASKQLITAKIDSFEKAENLTQLRFEKMSGKKDRYKVRVGNYRIVFIKASDKEIRITAIANRKDIYNQIFGITFSL